MMRRLTESELSRDPARTLHEAPAASPEHTQRAALLSQLQRVLAAELSSDQLLALRPRLEHAIARGLRGDP